MLLFRFPHAFAADYFCKNPAKLGVAAVGPRLMRRPAAGASGWGRHV